MNRLVSGIPIIIKPLSRNISNITILIRNINLNHNMTDIEFEDKCSNEYANSLKYKYHDEELNIVHQSVSQNEISTIKIDKVNPETKITTLIPNKDYFIIHK